MPSTTTSTSPPPAPHRVLRMGMIGGGQGAFIGAVHRMAAALDNTAHLAAGCLSSTPDKALASGRELGLAIDRNYPTWAAMLEGESKRPAGCSPDGRIDFVSIVTPNNTHFEIAKAFASRGFHVMCDKPLCHTSDQANELVRIVREKNIVFAVTYNYSGYPLVKHAREIIKSGELGDLRKVVVEYNQGWLASRLESTGQKQADWRTDPARSGAGGAIGDIGSHAEQMVCSITGLELDAICADLTAFVPGRRLDDDANVLLRFKPAGAAPAAKGVLIASQISIGHENDFRIRVHGSKGSLRWRQEDPNALTVAYEGQPDQILRRGNGYISPIAAAGTRLPAGHPEAFLEAFANVYRNACSAIRVGAGGLESGRRFDFPDVQDGARGVRFIENVISSAASDQKWTSL